MIRPDLLRPDDWPVIRSRVRAAALGVGARSRVVEDALNRFRDGLPPLPCTQGPLPPLPGGMAAPRGSHPTCRCPGCVQVAVYALIRRAVDYIVSARSLGAT